MLFSIYMFEDLYITIHGKLVQSSVVHCDNSQQLWFCPLIHFVLTLSSQPFPALFQKGVLLFESIT